METTGELAVNQTKGPTSGCQIHFSDQNAHVGPLGLQLRCTLDTPGLLVFVN